jgi:hypothetical protein
VSARSRHFATSSLTPRKSSTRARTNSRPRRSAAKTGCYRCARTSSRPARRACSSTPDSGRNPASSCRTHPRSYSTASTQNRSTSSRSRISTSTTSAGTARSRKRASSLPTRSGRGPWGRAASRSPCE